MQITILEHRKFLLISQSYQSVFPPSPRSKPLHKTQFVRLEEDFKARTMWYLRSVLVSYGCCNEWHIFSNLKWHYRLSYSSGRKQKISFPALKSRCWHSCMPSRGSMGKSIPCLLLLPEAAPIPWPASLQLLPPLPYLFFWLSLMASSRTLSDSFLSENPSDDMVLPK